MSFLPRSSKRKTALLNSKTAAIDESDEQPQHQQLTRQQTLQRQSTIKGGSAKQVISDPEVEERFEALLAQSNLPPARIATLSKLSTEQKWTILYRSNKETTPQAQSIIEKLIATEQQPDIAIIKKLRVVLSSVDNDWITNFIKLEGHLALFKCFRGEIEIVRKLQKRTSEILAECCRCTRTLLNSEVAFQKVLEVPGALRYIYFCLPFVNIKTQTLVLSTLAAICLVSEQGHKELSEAFQTSPQRIIILKKTLKSKDPDLAYATLLFINTLINQIEDVNARLTLRNSMTKFRIKVGVKRIKLKDCYGASNLETQVLIWEESCKQDEYGGEEGRAFAMPTDPRKTNALDSAEYQLLFGVSEMGEQVNANTNNNNNKQILNQSNQKWKAASNVKGRQKAVDALKIQIEELNNKLKVVLDENETLRVAIQEQSRLASQKNDVNNVSSTPINISQNATEKTINKDDQLNESEKTPEIKENKDELISNTSLEQTKETNEEIETDEDEQNEENVLQENEPVVNKEPPPPPPINPLAPPSEAPQAPVFGLLTKKKKQVPAVKMRNLNWTTLNAQQIKKSIWDDVDESPYYKLLDLKEFESLFEAVEGKVEPKEEPKKSQYIYLLPSKRGNNIQITLKGLKVSPENIISAIETLNESAFSIEEFSAIKTTMPTTEEIELLNTYQGDVNSLGPAEQYLIMLMKIPNASDIMSSLVSKITFNDKMEEINHDLSTLRSSAEGLKKSQALNEILKLILALGNYMNGTSARGGAWGFKIESLRKIIEVKSNTNISLMHYLMETIITKKPELLSFRQEIGSVHEAAKVNLADIPPKLQKVEEGIKLIGSTIENPKCEDNFKNVFEPFYKAAMVRVAKAKDDLDETTTEFKSTLSYFGEAANVPSYYFFDTWSNFLLKTIEAMEENKTRKEAKEKPVPVFTSKVVGGKAIMPISKGTLDAALAALKTANVGTAYNRQVTLVAKRKATLVGVQAPNFGESQTETKEDINPTKSTDKLLSLVDDELANDNKPDPKTAFANELDELDNLLNAYGYDVDLPPIPILPSLPTPTPITTNPISPNKTTNLETSPSQTRTTQNTSQNYPTNSFTSPKQNPTNSFISPRQNPINPTQNPTNSFISPRQNPNETTSPTTSNPRDRRSNFLSSGHRSLIFATPPQLSDNEKTT